MRTKKGANWSLWVRDKTPRAPSPSPQPDLEARVDELENQLRTTNSELSAIRSKEKDTRDLALNTQSEVDVLRGLICQWIGMERGAVASAGNGPSQFVLDSGPKVAHDPLQMNQANGYGGIPNGSKLKPQTDARGFEAPMGFISYQETAPPRYDPVGTPTSAAGQCTLLHSPDYSVGENSDIPQAQTDTKGQTAPGRPSQPACPRENDSSGKSQAAGTSSGHQELPTADALLSSWWSLYSVAFPSPTDADGRTAPGGPSQQAFPEENGFTDMRQAEGTSSGQGPTVEALHSLQLGFHFGVPSSAPQASTRPKPSGHSTSSVTYVAPKPNPDTFNHGPQG